MRISPWSVIIPSKVPATHAMLYFPPDFSEGQENWCLAETVRSVPSHRQILEKSGLVHLMMDIWLETVGLLVKSNGD